MWYTSIIDILYECIYVSIILPTVIITLYLVYLIPNSSSTWLIFNQTLDSQQSNLY